MIRDCRITYRTFGELNADRSNVILVPTWFNGVSEDWKQYIGRNGLLDDSRFYIIVVDALGNGNSSSPSNHVRRGSAFPQFTIRDMVETQYRLLTSHLAIPRVFATAGVSMGGMQVFEWMTAYPDFQERAIPIVATPQMSRRDIALWSAFFNLGNLRRDAQAEEEPKRGGGFGRWLERISAGLGQARKYREPFNALRQFEAIVRHDVSRGAGGSLAEAARRVKARTLVVVATEDKALSPRTPLEFAEALQAEVVELGGSCGHNAYKCEAESLAAEIRRFLE